jgi:trigger factor
VRTDLQNELNLKQHRSLRNQMVGALLNAVNFDLPETMVNAETRNVVYDIVRENQQRGLSREVIERQKDEIYNFANRNARERVRAAFMLKRIAEKEGITVDQNELAQRIGALSAQNGMRIDQFVKLLQERNGFSEIEEQLLTGKALDFLITNAKIEDVPAGSAGSDPTPDAEPEPPASPS